MTFHYCLSVDRAEVWNEVTIRLRGNIVGPHQACYLCGIQPSHHMSSVSVSFFTSDPHSTEKVKSKISLSQVTAAGITQIAFSGCYIGQDPYYGCAIL